MSDNHYTNIFNVSGDGNTINFDQDIDAGNNEALQMVLKFLLTLLLSPVLIPVILMANGYKMMQGDNNLLGGDYGDE